MTFEDEQPASSSIGGTFEKIAEGGLLRLIASKPIQQAIGRLVLGVVDVPVAKLEQWAQGIRSDTAARKKVGAAVAEKARALATADARLIDRGLERWTAQLGKRQDAREDIALRTLAHCAEEGLPSGGFTSPSEEFMGLFEDIAERASSEALADLMARILAGEMRRPKSVSRRTLQVAAILDQEVIDALAEVAPYQLDGGWFHVPPGGRDGWGKNFWLLNSVSISNELGIRQLRFDDSDRAVIRVGNNAIVVTQHPQKFSWFSDGVELTPIGRELIGVLPVRHDRKAMEIARGFLEHPQVVKVELGDIVERHGAGVMENMVGVT